MTPTNQTSTRTAGQAPVRSAPTAELGGRLRQARLGRNMTQSDLADGQFSVSYISAVERGQIRPSLGALEKLAARLNVPTHDLLRTDGAGVGLGTEFFVMGERNEVELQLRAAQILTHQGQPREALRLLDPLRARGLSGRELALVGWQSARCALELKQGEQACKQAQAALEEAERVNDPEMRERIRLTLGEALSFAGKQQAALSQFRTAAEAAANGTVRDPLLRLRALFLLGSASRELGELDRAVVVLSEAATIANEVFIPERLAKIYWEVAEQCRASGDHRRARLYAAHSLAAYEEADNRRLARQALTRLGRTYAQTGQLSDAKALLESARERAELQQDSRALVEALTALAGIYLGERRTEDAGQAAEQAMELATSMQDAAQQADAHLMLARVLEARGDQSAAQHFEQAIERFKAAEAIYGLSDAYAQYSAYLERHDNNKRALEILKQAWQLRDGGAIGSAL